MHTLSNVLVAAALAASLSGCASSPPGHPIVAAPADGSRAKDTMRVMTLNVAHGARAPVPAVFFRRATIERNLSAIASLLRDTEPDVVALEELDRSSFYSDRIDHYEWIREESGLVHGAFGAHRDVPRGLFAMRHGTALLSALPLDAPDSVAFHAWALDDKGLVVATVRPPALGGREVDVVSIHLDPFLEGTRRAHVARTVAALRARGSRPLVVMGDMNAAWKEGRASLGELARGLGLRPYLAPDAEDTYPAGKHPWRRIDWILISSDLDFRGYRTLDPVVSDHRAVVAEIAMRAAM
jgi:endonuclease/exonuclease/phosphatase family metal-dependent hydrolase